MKQTAYKIHFHGVDTTTEQPRGVTGEFEVAVINGDTDAAMESVKRIVLNLQDNLGGVDKFRVEYSTVHTFGDGNVLDGETDED